MQHSKNTCGQNLMIWRQNPPFSVWTMREKWWIDCQASVNHQPPWSMQPVKAQDWKVVTMTTSHWSIRFLISGLDVPHPEPHPETEPEPDLRGPSAADVQTSRETRWWSLGLKCDCSWSSGSRWRPQFSVRHLQAGRILLFPLSVSVLLKRTF